MPLTKSENNYLYKQINREEILQRRKAYEQEHRDEHLKRCREYREKNKEFETLRLHLRDVYGITINKSMFRKVKK